MKKKKQLQQLPDRKKFQTKRPEANGIVKQNGRPDPENGYNQYMYKSETAKAQLPKQIQEERLLKQKGKTKHTTSSERILPEEAVNLTNQR